ncbi:MAG: hypothetical protein COA45_04270 [Zetaproteobacteria bacterium]|nr:MAG: hypothetical protein COA45_04270 [Zetaproteobacteria bacterium]
MTVMTLVGTLTYVSANFINPYTGDLLVVDGDYYINDQYVNGGTGTGDILLGTSYEQFYRLEDDAGNLLIEGFEQIYPSTGSDILLLASTTHVLGDMIIHMTGGDDILWANAGNDTIGGGRGDDILHGGPGHDVIDGGDDNDTLTGGQGDDTIDGGSGFDTAVYIGAYSNYVITDNGGVLTIEDMVGTDGTDSVENVERVEFLDGFLEGGVFTQVVTDDTFIGTTAAESFDGGGGTDSVDYSASLVRVRLDLETGGTHGDAAGDSYTSIENVIGTNSADYIYGDAGENHIQGLSGGDYLEGGAGADVIDGGANSDYVTYTRSDSAVDVDLTRATQIGGDAQGDTLISIERIKGSDYDDVLTGDSLQNYLRGGDGNDTLSGGLGNDRLYGDEGDDTYLYTAGKDKITEKGNGYDTVVFDATWSPNDVIISGNVLNFSGNVTDKITFKDITLIEEFHFDGFAPMDLATLQSFGAPVSYTGTGADDVFTGSVYAETFDGGAASDTVDYSNGLVRVVLDMQNGGTEGDAAGDSYISIENVIGTNFADFIYGDAGDNYIQALAGGDYLEGGAGADVIDGGTGSDYVTYTRSGSAVDVDLTRATQIGGDAQGDSLISIERIKGSDYDDSLTGDAQDNHLRGEDGNDTLNGGLGDDSLYGNAGDDTLFAGDDDDNLYGGAGNDILYGGSGSDVLNGGAGVDALYGQAGADRFVFEGADAFSGLNQVQDFSLAEGDVLDVSDLLSVYDELTDAISDFVQITESGSDSFLYVDYDGGADNFVQVATLFNVTGLTDEDALETSGSLVTF